jgi:hypothetical protein
MKRNTVHFFVAITAFSLFILCLIFLEGEKKRVRESNGDKKMHGVPRLFCILGAPKYLVSSSFL